MKLHYWFKEGLKMAGSILILSIIHITIIYVQDTGNAYENLLAMGPVYLILFGSMISMIFSITLYTVNIPIALSFGSTRKEVLVGVQFYRLISMITIVPIATLLANLIGEKSYLSARTVIPIGIGLFFIFSTLGTGLGILQAKFGKGVVLVATIIGTLGIIAVVGAIVFVISKEFQIKYNFSWFVLAVGILAYALVLIPEIKVVHKMNVKL